MKATRIIYALAWLLPIVLVVLSLTGTIKPANQTANESRIYILSIATVALTLLTAYLAMKLFAFSAVKKRMQTQSGAQRQQTYNALCSLRILMVLAALLFDLAAYYITGSDSPLYLAAIVGIALLFCWPQKMQ